MLKQVTTVFSTVLTLWASAQSAEWLTTGNTGQNALTDFLGNTDGIPMNIRTQDIRRFTLLPDAAYTIGNPGDFPSQVRDGALLLSPDVDGFISGGAPGPFTALHLAGVGVNWQEQTFRPWMRNGVTFTGNSDHGYIGQKCKLVGDTAAEISDKTDMVAHWSGDPGGIYGPDRSAIFSQVAILEVCRTAGIASKAWKPCA